jgi:hypothetical protein
MRQVIVIIPLPGIFCHVLHKKIVLPPGAKLGGNYSQGLVINGTLCNFHPRRRRCRWQDFEPIVTPR